jgi:hypothetical protein
MALRETSGDTPARGWTATNDDALGVLTHDLASNYLDTSLRIDERKDTLRERIFTPEFLALPSDGNPHRWQASRNILVLGAGASAAAFGTDEFPTVEKAIGRIRSWLEEQWGAGEEFISSRLEEESERLRVSYGFSKAPTDFETQLGILAGIYSPQKVAAALTHIYGERYWPHIIFELIAHLLKHRFLDAVINFNFDELLDEAIEEEIGASHHHYIFSDGHCRSLAQIMVGDRLKIPLHIKPHGTVSHASTLRFTKEHYFQLPEGIRAFMQKILSGHYRDDVKEGESYQPYRTNIISVGFGMNSLDLLQMLNSAVYHPDGKPRRPNTELALFHINRAGWGDPEALRKSTGIDRQYFVDVNSFTQGLEGVLRTLWKRVQEPFTEPFQPRGIARHEIVHMTFFDNGSVPGTAGCRVPRAGRRRRPQSDANYFFARLCVEVALALAKGNGRVDLSKHFNDRVGIYFDQLQNLKEPHPYQSFNAVIAAFGGTDQLHLGGYARNILSVANAHQWTSAEDASRKLSIWLWERLHRALSYIQDPDLESRLTAICANITERERFISRLKVLVDSDAQDISPNFGHRHLLLFTEPDPDEVLHTNLSLTINFVKMIERPWDLMLAVSEHGKVLQKLERHTGENRRGLRGRHVCLVVADTDHNPTTNRRLRGYLPYLIGDDRQRFYRLPADRHNEHMILLLRWQEDPEDPFMVTGGIHYRKSGLGNRVNPVYVSARHEPDLDRLLDTFCGYVRQAQVRARAEPARVQRNARMARSAAEVVRARATRAELLAYWWQEIGRRDKRMPGIVSPWNLPRGAE